MKNKIDTTKIETLNVSLSCVPSLEVIKIYIKEAKKRKMDYIYFDVPMPFEYGLGRTYFYLKV